jgi:hypothetical protein
MAVQRRFERKEIAMSIEELLAAGAVGSWRTIVGRLSRIFESADEEKLQRQVAPEKIVLCTSSGISLLRMIGCSL